jgi:glucose-6-phosphate isomerase
MAVHLTKEEFEKGQKNNTTLHPPTSPLLRRASNAEVLTPGPLHTNKSSNYLRRIILDFSRQHVTGETMELLFDLADRMGLTERMNEMRSGYNINFTERTAVMHHVLRMPRGYDFQSRHPRGNAILGDVHSVLDRIEKLAEERSRGNVRGCTGKVIKNIVCIGIGGSFAGPQAVYEALRGDVFAAAAAAEGDKTIRFVANVDPVDFDSNTKDLKPEETLIIVTTKSFNTPETLQNSTLARRWLVKHIASNDITEVQIIRKHFFAVTLEMKAAESFGIHKDNIFPMWEWVGGRFSVWSAAGMLPLSLHYSFDVMRNFLAGGHDIDEHFFDAPLGGNIPVLLGLLGVWNSTFMGYHTRALLPYSHALRKFPSLVQKFDMESNGKRVTSSGIPLSFQAGEIDFGEAGSNGQHSFYQLLHQGRTVPADFIGFMESQSSLDEEFSCEEAVPTDGWDGELEISGHDKLMSNFFAQPDALAHGKSLNELVQEDVPEYLRQHKVFPGNRPSSSILMTKLDAFAVGQLLAIYEHRTAVQGFIWGINSFDQFGTEIGKVLAKGVRAQLSASRRRGASVQGFNESSRFLLEAYLSHRR